MTLDELNALEAKRDALRAEREEHNQARLAAREKARKLSEQIRELEQQMPSKKERHKMRLGAGTDTRMSVEPATVSLKGQRLGK